MNVSLTVLAASLMLLLDSCGKDDPAPPNLKEEIGSVGISIKIPGSEEDFFVLCEDPEDDGIYEAIFGGVEPVLNANTIYTTQIIVYDESDDVINEEIIQERGDHLFCFSSTNNIISFDYAGSVDQSNTPFGLVTEWTTGNSGSGTVTVTLRHQPGVKTGTCPGDGEDDFSLSFPLQLVD